MKSRVTRSTVDLSEYPDLVVIYLGMRVNTLKGFMTMLHFIPQVGKAMREETDGLLSSSYWFYSIRHIGLRQYWRDFESLETWARSLPHKMWWQEFLQNSGGMGFYHEAYFRQGGMEGMYVDMVAPFGFMNFAPVHPARDHLFSARSRANIGGTPIIASAVTEEELYGTEGTESPVPSRIQNLP